LIIKGNTEAFLLFGGNMYKKYFLPTKKPYYFRLNDIDNVGIRMNGVRKSPCFEPGELTESQFFSKDK